MKQDVNCKERIWGVHTAFAGWVFISLSHTVWFRFSLQLFKTPFLTENVLGAFKNREFIKKKKKIRKKHVSSEDN